jgi:membrane associated rhomboid family serine protease
MDRSPFSLTPWVRRVLAAMGAVYLLQLTVFTSPWLIETFGFAPSEALRHPWGALSYTLLHGSFLHFLGNSIGLFMFGPPVEARLGSPRFLRLLLVSAVGGPVLSLLFQPLAGDAIIIGASAALFGVMLAFVREWPDAPIFIFPLPVPVKAKWLVAFLAGIALVFGLLGRQDGVAHFAHLGGFAAAWLFLRAGTWPGRRPAARPVERPSAVLVRSSNETPAHRAPAPPQGTAPQHEEAARRAELDRVLDKISARGRQSLTAEERRFLDEISQRFRQER